MEYKKKKVVLIPLRIDMYQNSILQFVPNYLHMVYRELASDV